MHEKEANATSFRRFQADVAELIAQDIERRLRVDDNPDPLVELRRLYEESKAEYLPFKEKLATRANPAGIFGKALTEAMVVEQAERDRSRLPEAGVRSR